MLFTQKELNISSTCPCQSGMDYAHCCYPIHQRVVIADSAEKLMRSRYSAYVKQYIEYLIQTTLPYQQKLLNVQAIHHWSSTTQWAGLKIIDHIPNFTSRHAIVEFNAYFYNDEAKLEAHHEISLFVKCDKYWYFVDPSTTFPPKNSACICGSGKKLKNCCGMLQKIAMGTR